MKNFRFLAFVLTIATLVLSACGAAAATPTAVSADQKVDAMPVAFVGIVDSITGDQWVISGTTVTVDASIVRDGPFNVGDQIKVEGLVNPDGSLTVSRVEAPAPQDAATQPPLAADNTNEAISNANTNDANVNDDSSASNTNDDNSNSANVNDDNGSDSNTNDDNSNGTNVNDDSGGSNTNDDQGNDSNSNDDQGGNSNSDDSNGNDDNSGGGNDNGGGSDDSGGGSDDNGNGG